MDPIFIAIYAIIGVAIFIATILGALLRHTGFIRFSLYSANIYTLCGVIGIIYILVNSLIEAYQPGGGIVILLIVLWVLPAYLCLALYLVLINGIGRHANKEIPIILPTRLRQLSRITGFSLIVPLVIVFIGIIVLMLS